MANPILPDQASAANLQLILPVLYSADQKVDSTTATAIWDWAKNNFTDQQVKEIQEDPDQRPFLELAVRIVEKVNKHDYKVTSLPEVVENFREHQQQIDKERTQEAQAMLAKNNKSHLADKVMASLRQTQQNTATADPSSAAPLIINASESTIFPEAVFEPATTAAGLVSVIETTSQIPDASYTMTSFVKDVVVELLPEIGATADAVEQKIAAAAPKATPEQTEEVTAQILATEIAHPEISVADVVAKASLALEAQGIVVQDLMPVTEILADFGRKLTLTEKVEATLAHEYEAQAGLDPQTAKEITRLVTFNKLPDIAWAVAKSAKAKPEDSPEKRRIRQVNIFADINRTVLNSLADQIPKSTFQRLVNISNYSRVYELYSSQTYEEPDYRIRDGQGQSHSSPALDFLKNQAQSYLKDEAWSAWQSFAGGGIGEAIIPAAAVPVSTAIATMTAAPVVGVLVGESTPMWIAASVEIALTKGTLVYAGTLATGEMMFVPPATLAGTALTTTGGTALATAGGAEAAALAGQTAIPIPIVGAIIGAIIGFIVANFPKIWKWIKDKFEEYIFPLIGGLLLLGLTAGGALLAGFGAAATFAVGALGFGAGAMMGSQIPTFVSGGVQAVLQPVGAFASTIFGGIVELAVVEIATPIIIIILSIPVVVALLLFIINSSAYVVPQSNSFAGTSSLLGPGGQYPSCWPVNSGSISQGPYLGPNPSPGTEGYTVCHDKQGNVITCSHVGERSNAIDIGIPTGSSVFATHDGVATTHDWTVENTQGYGNLVTVTSTDGTFVTYYAHLQEFRVTSGVTITAGTLIAISDNTGNSTGDHVHYELKKLGSAASPIDLCTFPNGLINNCVPPYSVGSPITGCVASSAGGSKIFVSPTP